MSRKRVTKRQVATLFRKTAKRLEANGWTQGEYGPSCGPNCLSGAMSFAAGYDPVGADGVNDQVIRKAKQYIKAKTGMFVVDLNDNHLHSQQEAAKFLRLCARELDHGASLV